MKIERPEWFVHYAGEELNMWFTKNIEGKIVISPGDLRELWGNKRGRYWDDHPPGENYGGEEFTQEKTHTAYLILSSMKPIKKETREEKLEKALGDILNNYEKCHQNPHNKPTIGWGYLDRAKAVLDEK